MLKRYADTHYNATLQGVIYERSFTHKYVTYQFEPFVYEKDGEEIHVDRAKVNIKGYRTYKGIKDELKEVDMVVSKDTQIKELDRGYYTDYMYDEILQYYNAETGKWTEKVMKDQVTNNMPLE